MVSCQLPKKSKNNENMEQKHKKIEESRTILFMIKKRTFFLSSAKQKKILLSLYNCYSLLT